MANQNKQNIQLTDDLEDEIPLTAIVDINQSKIMINNDIFTIHSTDEVLSSDIATKSKRPRNVKYVCRICLKSENKMISLMSMVGHEVLADMFSSISSIKVHLQERLPLQICAPCHDSLVQCYRFKLKCNHSNSILRSLMKETCNFTSHNTENFEKIDKTTQTSVDDFVEEKEILQSTIENYDLMDNGHIKMESTVKTEINDYGDEIEYLEDDIFYENDGGEHEDNERELKAIQRTDNSELKERVVNQRNYKNNKRGNKKRLNCNKCFKSFLKSKTLRTHIKQCDVSKTIKPFACGQCKESFNSEEDLHIHSALHVKGSQWTCNKCFKNFTERNRFRRHIRRHMSLRFACEVCSKTFPELCALRRHARVHTGEKIEKKYQCDVCQKRFCDSSQLAAHSSRHTGVRPCTCAECGKAFPSRRLLASHRRVHSDLKPHACRYCDKRFRHESTRNTHHRTHTGEKPFVCSICGKTFIQSSNLKLHMRTHTGERPYTCDICDRKFTSGSSLTSHRRTHTGEKPYSCPICGKRFARTDIRTHMRQHTGERPFACCVCSKKFVNAARLRDHYLIHTGEKPYECAICNEKFKKKSYLAKHIKNHEKDKKTKEKKINKEKNILIVQQVPFMVDNNLIYTENVNEIAINGTGESNVNCEDENKDTLVTEEVPLEVSGELVLDDNNVKAELVVVNMGHNDSNYQEEEICLSSNNIIYNNDDPNTSNGDLVPVNENEVNISDGSAVVEGNEVKLYQLDQSLVQIQTSGRHITIRKITSKMTTNFN